MELIFLGTSSMVPTKLRNHTSALLLYKDEGIMIDCGEGTQRQLKIAGIKPTKITKLLISHWHGDHVFGLPGLLQTLGADEYKETLEIYGPKGSKSIFHAILNAFMLKTRIKYKIIEVESGIFFENKKFVLSALPLKHTTQVVGYRFQEKDTRRIQMSKAKKIGIPEGPLLGKLQQGKSIKLGKITINPEQVSTLKAGKSIAFVTDTKLVDNCYQLAKNCSLLVCEATFADELEAKANKYMHLTAKQAAQIALKANAKQLILTHFSQRYKNTKELEKSAKAIFKHTIMAIDLMRVSI